MIKIDAIVYIGIISIDRQRDSQPSLTLPKNKPLRFYALLIFYLFIPFIYLSLQRGFPL